MAPAITLQIIADMLPPGVVKILTGSARDIGDALVGHPLVRTVNFTGSIAIGQRVMRVASQNVTPVTLELGGKSPNIVFADADMDNAVNGVISGIFAASGQTCIAGSRLLLERSIHDEFLEKLLKLAKTARLSSR